MKTQHRRTIVATITLGCVLVGDSVALSAEPVDFRRNVAPILRRRCLICHNDQDRRGGLSLQSAEMVGKGGDSGKVFEPGDAESSYLLDLVIPVEG